MDYPQWTPRPCPQTSTNGDLEVTLVEFTRGDVPVFGWNPVRPDVVHGYAALFKVDRKGEPAPEWRPETVEVTDATGNFLVPKNRYSDDIAGFKQCRFTGALWPSENAWN